MAARLRAGQAVRLGSLPGSPARWAGRYWRPDPADGQWLPITDPGLAARLARDQTRLAAARAAAAATAGGPGDGGDRP